MRYVTCEDLALMARHYPAFILESKVRLDEEGNVMTNGLDLITGKYEDYGDKNGPPTKASLKSEAFLGHGL